MRKKTSVAPAATNPIADFINNLPQKTTLLGFRYHRSPKKSEISLAYLFGGKTIQTSITQEGGEL
ncbi:MAG: hypothetical protein LBJ72_12820 [Dysgonamonadaceae bacterium]|jgi:hypothetical protein|nr:hypothetical protein [Dysgonamonadaceae bacterium]